MPADIVDLAPDLESDAIETKGNPYHDPANGRFTFGPGGIGGAPGYRGMTARRPGIIKPVGGGTDRNGRHRPVLFPPDPYAFHSPQEALAHYISGSGEERNYYFNEVDTSRVSLSVFPKIAKLAASAAPGIYPINDAGEYSSGVLGKSKNLTSAATVGRLVLRADGVLAIAKNGSYQFIGRLSAKHDRYDFNRSHGRSKAGEASTTVGRWIPDKPFRVNLIGSEPFSARGRQKIVK